MKLRYTRRALNQLDSILLWIARDNPTAANKQIDRIEQSIELLERFPKMGHTGKSAGTLELVVPGTPYIVVYRLAPDVIQILSVADGRRKSSDT
jgi:addiction module RelE/StbE family toxin